jgi:CBS-domain-containing membrane protein
LFFEFNFRGSDLKNLLKKCCQAIDIGTEDLEDMLEMINNKGIAV